MHRQNDTHAFAAYAVKLLLRALVDDGGDGNKMRFAAATMWEAMRPSECGILAAKSGGTSLQPADCLVRLRSAM